MDTIEDLADKMKAKPKTRLEVKLPDIELAKPFIVKPASKSMMATLEGKIMTSIWVDIADKWITATEFQNPSQEFGSMLASETQKDLIWVANEHFSRPRIKRLVDQYLSAGDLSQLLWFIVTGEVDEGAFESVEVNKVKKAKKETKSAEKEDSD